ncbi:MAG TPA: DUF3106 domain-containing protein [Casimicrobiaceae bacterium]|jgi:hypothetical protein|nr:DUF3106 domain-containing protein [Casimicrobiaceae bacterium]
MVLHAPTWAELSPADKQTLAPLANEWDSFPAERRQKWLGIAKRYPKMAPAEQQRVQQQMHAWVNLTPAERQAAREQYKNLKQLPPDKRQHMTEKWEEYQQLPPDKKRELASRPQTGGAQQSPPKQPPPTGAQSPPKQPPPTTPQQSPGK